MTLVEFIDTSVLCNLLDIPHLNQDHASIAHEFKRKRGRSGTAFVLPVTTIIETGNHIAQVAGGRERRTCAQRFSSMLDAVASGAAPFVLHELGWDQEFLRLLLRGGSTQTSLIEHATAQLGCGDLSILAERDRYLSGVARSVRATIWTLDEALSAWA